MSSKAKPSAWAEEAQAEEKPQEAPRILKAATRLKLRVPTMEATMPRGEQRATPSLIIRSWW